MTRNCPGVLGTFKHSVGDIHIIVEARKHRCYTSQGRGGYSRRFCSCADLPMDREGNNCSCRRIQGESFRSGVYNMGMKYEDEVTMLFMQPQVRYP